MLGEAEICSFNKVVGCIVFPRDYFNSSVRSVGRKRVRLEMKNKITKEALCPPHNNGYTPLKRRIAADVGQHNKRHYDR